MVAGEVVGVVRRGGERHRDADGGTIRCSAVRADNGKPADVRPGDRVDAELQGVLDPEGGGRLRPVPAVRGGRQFDLRHPPQEAVSPMQELPKYKCHKEVWALKIKEISGTTITPAEDGYAPFEVTAEYVAKHNPQAGGYYVEYAPDGYKSYSPAKPFEDGYTRL